MEQEREVREILMNMRGMSKAMKGMFLFNNTLAAGGIMLLMTFMRRLLAEKLVKAGEVKSLEKFIVSTSGDYEIQNIPDASTSTSLSAVELEKELKNIGIQYAVIPDLNKEDGIIQVAIQKGDRSKFQAWFDRYLMWSLRGGEKSIQDLQNLTNNNDSIISIPLEGKQELIKEDFLSLGINYAVLPDLNVGDGEIQLMVANGDVQKVQHWYKLYREECFRGGEELGELQLISSADYGNTGLITEAKYIEQADETYKRASEKYNQPPGSIESLFLSEEQKVRQATDVGFLEYYNNPEYVALSINRETLVEKSSYAGGDTVNSQGFFASRVPGTWGESEQTLILPAEQVFVTDEGHTYLAYLHKEQKPIIMDAKGELVTVEQRPTGGELFATHYQQVDSLVAKKSMDSLTTKVAKDVGERIPANPIKAR
ncbi:hypothetical protein [Ohessyouella blattaphilus]|uniref:Uncharacterized protein n=2 Tax=Ohessyouella blattaphilus TaxID=2949333 RepID=A0ABT1EM97_9FIRM|nr:hypothetical protein [Ohessyouella blattaphilus]MCP1111589.1 hypothetical protein [Ohessyouella blattaphilus]MCR8564983.1 hypothetical protein [Ohessyouella blattaphilus]